MSICICGNEFEPLGARGRPRKYCSDKCRARAYRRRRHLPPALVDRDAWTRRSGKRPIMMDGSPASSTNPGTWAPFDVVASSNRGDGYGIMLGDGLGCYDLDHCLIENELTSWARDALAEIEERVIWVERSMSGDGLHVFVEAPEGRGYRNDGVEFYSRARFIAVTGDRWGEELPKRARQLSNSEFLREQYRELAAEDAGVKVLLEEACRIVDRLDNIDGVITGKSEWIKLMHFRLDIDAEQDVYVHIDQVMSESRQQATILRHLLNDLRLSASSGRARGNSAGETPTSDNQDAESQSGTEEPGKAVSVEDIRARRAARIAGSAVPAST